MALDKQISIYGIDTGHFFSNKERVLYNRNSKLRWEKAKLKSKSDKILSKIKSKLTKEELQCIQKGSPLPLVIQSETEEKLLQYQRFMNLIKMKNQKIKQSKQELLKILEKKMELRALSPNPNVKPEELKAITSEIAALRAKIRAVNDEFYANMDKAGLPCGDYGCAWHGDGYGYGHGRHGCWR